MKKPLHFASSGIISILVSIYAERPCCGRPPFFSRGRVENKLRKAWKEHFSISPFRKTIMFRFLQCIFKQKHFLLFVFVSFFSWDENQTEDELKGEPIKWKWLRHNSDHAPRAGKALTASGSRTQTSMFDATEKWEWLFNLQAKRYLKNEWARKMREVKIWNKLVKVLLL